MTEASLGWSWTYADDASNNSQPRDVEVDRAVARQFAARARQEAVVRNRAGDYAQARQALHGTAKRIRTYANRDTELRGIVDELEAETTQFSGPMPAMLLKQAHFAAGNSSRSRDASGRSLRRSS